MLSLAFLLLVVVVVVVSFLFSFFFSFLFSLKNLLVVRSRICAADSTYPARQLLTNC